MRLITRSFVTLGDHRFAPARWPENPPRRATFARDRLFGGLCAALALLPFLSVGRAGRGTVASVPTTAESAGSLDFQRGKMAFLRRDYGAALADWTRASTVGNAKAMYDIGLLYDQGLGVSQNYARAMACYREAAAAGDTYAMTAVGVLYARGHGVPRDRGTAATWFRRAAGRGNAVAMVNLGVLYRHGWGVPRDYGRALWWWRKAAAGGDADAMNDVGCLYDSGLGVPENHWEAAMWWWRAAGRGNLSAKRALVVMCAWVLFLVALALICYLARSCYCRLPRRLRRLSPGLVWLLLTPGLAGMWDLFIYHLPLWLLLLASVFGLSWAFLVFLKLAASYRGYFASLGRADSGDCGLVLARWFCGCATVWGLVYLVSPCCLTLWIGTVPGLLVVFFLAKMVRLRNQIGVPPPGAAEGQ